MSESNEPSDVQSEVEFIREVRDSIFPFDPSLETLLTYINLSDTTEIGLTLHVKGAVVSGLAVSGRRFFSLLIHAVEEARDRGSVDAAGSQMITDFYRPTLEALEKDQTEYRASNKLPPRPRHVHMRHVLTYPGGGSDPLRHELWRGRLTEVDGWSLGNTEKVPPLPEGVG